MAEPKPTFEQFVEKERERLRKAREEAYERLNTAQAEMNAIDQELKAIQAYELAKQGKLDLAPKEEKAARTPRAARDPNAPRRTREGGKRDDLLKVISEAGTEGMTRADLINHYNVKGDKKGEQSISNALSNLKKEGKLKQLDNKAYVV